VNTTAQYLDNVRATQTELKTDHTENLGLIGAFSRLPAAIEEVRGVTRSGSAGRNDPERPTTKPSTIYHFTGSSAFNPPN